MENSFNNIKFDLIEHLKQLFIKYDVLIENEYSFHKNKNIYSSKEIGYSIRNGKIKITCGYGLRLEHEIGHIILINNFDKLLVDNWGMKVFDIENHKLIHKWLIGTEAKVWGIENFISKNKRTYNKFWIYNCIPNSKYSIDLLTDDEVNQLSKIERNVIHIMNRYETNMTNQILFDKLEERFSFIRNNIGQNFNSLFCSLL